MHRSYHTMMRRQPSLFGVKAPFSVPSPGSGSRRRGKSQCPPVMSYKNKFATTFQPTVRDMAVVFAGSHNWPPTRFITTGYYTRMSSITIPRFAAIASSALYKPSLFITLSYLKKKYNATTSNITKARIFIHMIHVTPMRIAKQTTEFYQNINKYNAQLKTLLTDSFQTLPT
jgi:hypothetical protein